MSEDIQSPPAEPERIFRALRAVARERKAEVNAVLIQYAIERLLFRLSVSSESENYVLKGAMLFRVWTGDLHRPTRDVDFLGFGESTPTAVADSMRTVIATVALDDGLRFDSESLTARRIQAVEGYEGVNLSLKAYLAHIPITVRIDVGFGDVVTPAASERPFPTLLGHEAPVIRSYPHETALAEKVEAMCRFGSINSRLKDYYDVIAISRRFDTEGAVLVRAIRATFERRGTPIPGDIPPAVVDAFASDLERQAQWGGYLRRQRIEDVPVSFVESMQLVRDFILPPLGAASRNQVLRSRWIPGTGWNGDELE